MAAGRGDLFRTFLPGLERTSMRAPADRQPNSGRPQSGPGRARAAFSRSERSPKTAPGRTVRGNDPSWLETRMKREKAGFNHVTSTENLIERLPIEILIKILSNLDASALFCISSVSRLFHQLSSDNGVWQKIYRSNFGSQTWKPKLAVLKEEPEEAEPGHWKKQYMWMMVGQEVNKWRRELRDLRADTGLPQETERILRKFNLSWELTVGDCFGRRRTFEQSRACFFDTSVIISWSGSGFPSYHHFRSIQLHGVRRVTHRNPEARRSCWRSLISELQVKPHPDQIIGKDQLISLVDVSGFLVGVWRSRSGVAFVMTCLHFHRLVERSLLGTPLWPYFEPVDPPPEDGLGPQFGLHGYMLHFVLHNIDTKIISGCFHLLAHQTIQVEDGLMELTVIDPSDLQQHRSLSGSVRLPWRTGCLGGSVQNCCFMTLTLLQEFQKPVWCTSAPICLRMAPSSPSCDYSGEHFLMERRDAGCKVALRLVWLREQQQFLLISLIIHVPVPKAVAAAAQNHS